MEPTRIENKPETYTRPILLTKNDRPYISKKEPEVFNSINIQYLFDNNLNSSPSGYDLSLNGSISYETSPTSIHLNGSSYLSGDITIDVKTLGFWFKINSPTIDNYLISTADDVFNIKISNTELNITINGSEQPILYDFLYNKWHHLLLNYSNEKYEIYIDSNLVQETVDYIALTDNTLYLGKSLESYNYELITLDQNYSLYKHHEMITIDSNLYLFGDINTVNTYNNKLYKIDLSVNVMEEISIQDKNTETSITIKSRNFISMVSLDKYIYLCGGINSSPYSISFISIDTKTNIFEFSSFTGVAGVANTPTQRTGHSIVVVPKPDTDSVIIHNPSLTFYIFGGYYPTPTSTSTYYNDLYRFTESAISTKITMNNYTPTERAHHSMVADLNYLYIFGGYKDNTYYNDFYKIEILPESYTSVKKDFPEITKRSYHKMAIIENNIFILGGKNSADEILYDMHIINKNTLELLYSFNSLLPENLSDYSMSVSNNDIYIYGGLTDSYNEHDVWIAKVVQSNLYKITNTTTNLDGNIADLRLYNYSVTDISTIYDEFFNTIPLLPTDFTKTFDNQTIGGLNMLSDVPSGTTELNIINNSILYNSNYGEGSGLYIDFTKLNLQNVIKITITNNGTIYGRGGIGQTPSSHNRREGKYAITVLNNDDTIVREITITNNGNIYGGGDGGYFIIETTVSYLFTYRQNNPNGYDDSNGNNYALITINAEGGDAQYYDGTDVIDAGTPYTLLGATIFTNRPSLPAETMERWKYEYANSSYADKPLNNGGEAFNTSKIIYLPSNGLVTSTYM
jgi:hypothetical protein